MRHRVFAVAATAAFASSLLATTASAQYDGPLPENVSITVTMDRPESAGPKVLAVTDVPVGDGPELTGADVTSNPSDLETAITVDIDDEGIVVATETVGESLSLLSITIEGEGLGVFDPVSNDLFSNDGENAGGDVEDGTLIQINFETLATLGWGQIVWEVVDPPTWSYFLDETGTAVFAFFEEPEPPQPPGGPPGPPEPPRVTPRFTG